ncbi:hypothetical protein DUNSADRAFT_2005 [Dunaliella salina]|uniref:ODAD1 central coiled coil region domain-containing protein n=1 Tax=Dunaliella salina TaxID=3046 RepID=A0ABQ7GWC8_DUNSA|nr:hypothetical protein DUNSADRAFT_2005 [Dunaliella salina]|eukprot:KAF5838914.1 hypothetical protein DUNSADRAFT_2005 [Dunaliella salina]
MHACFPQAQTKRIEGVVEAAEGGSPAARPPLSSGTQAKDSAASGTHAKDSTASGAPAKDSTATAAGALNPDAIVAWMKQASRISDLNSMVNHFCRLESLNYHLFDACNQANVRIATLQKELQSAQADLEHLESTEMMSRHKEVTANTLAKRDQALKRAEALHDKQVLLERRIALVRAGMSQALRTLGTSLAPPSRPEDPSSVYATLLQNLGTLETKARAVLSVYSKIMDKNTPGSEDHAGGLVRPSSSGSSASIGSHIPPAALPARPPSSLARPPSSITTKSPRVRGRPGLETGLSRASSSSSNEDSDGSPAVPLSREQLQAQLYAQN